MRRSSQSSVSRLRPSLVPLRRWAGASVCALALTLASCIDQDAETTIDTGSAIAAGTNRAARENAPPILSQMEGILDRTAFRGVRRVFQRYDGSTLEQFEDVGADGNGHFSIELVDVVSLPQGLDSLAYEILFESSSRFLWTARDFQVHSAAPTIRNYEIGMLPERPIVAEIQCVRLSFRRFESIGGRPGLYHVDLDPDTGFVLAWREFDDAGGLLAEVVYESFDYDGDVSDMVLRGRRFAARALSLSSSLAIQAGFAVRVPDTLPPGMEFTVAEVLDVPVALAAGDLENEASFLPGGEWLRLLASDGIEVMVFMHSAETASAPASFAGDVRMNQSGVWELGLGQLDGTTFVLAARATLDQLVGIIQSAF